MFIETSPNVYFNLSSAIKIKFIYCVYDEITYAPDCEIYSQVVVYTPLMQEGKRVVYNFYSNRDEAIYSAIGDYVKNNTLALEEHEEITEEIIQGD